MCHWRWPRCMMPRPPFLSNHLCSNVCFPECHKDANSPEIRLDWTLVKPTTIANSPVVKNQLETESYNADYEYQIFKMNGSMDRVSLANGISRALDCDTLHGDVPHSNPTSVASMHSVDCIARRHNYDNGWGSVHVRHMGNHYIGSLRVWPLGLSSQ